MIVQYLYIVSSEEHIMSRRYDDPYSRLNNAYDPLRPGGDSQVLGNYHDSIVIRPSPKVQDEQYIFHTIIIDSQNRDQTKWPNPNDYVVDLSTTFRDIVSLELLNLVVAKSEPTINSNNNSFSFAEDQSSVTSKNFTNITIPNGQYSASDLLTVLAQEMTNASTQGVTYTATQDSKTGRMTLTASGGSASSPVLSLNSDSDNNISQMLGVKSQSVTFQGGSARLTGSQAMNLSGQKYILMEMDGISNNYGTSDASQGSFAQIVVADIEYGQYKHLRGVDWGRCLVRFNPLLPKLSRFHIRFKRSDGKLYDFDGVDNSMVIELKCKFKQMDY